MLAQAPGGLSCFLVPRWRPDGTHNPLQFQRQKQAGHVANASSEVELSAGSFVIGQIVQDARSREYPRSLSKKVDILVG
jgi:putative acyl-CoA dehydrogenase